MNKSYFLANVIYLDILLFLDFNEFKYEVHRNFSIVKQKLELILQKQSDFHEQWQNNNTTLNSIEDNEVNVMSQFPIETDNTLNEVEDALTDNNYRNKLVK